MHICSFAGSLMTGRCVGVIHATLVTMCVRLKSEVFRLLGIGWHTCCNDNREHARNTSSTPHPSCAEMSMTTENHKVSDTLMKNLCGCRSTPCKRRQRPRCSRAQIEYLRQPLAFYVKPEFRDCPKVCFGGRTRRKKEHPEDFDTSLKSSTQSCC